MHRVKQTNLQGPCYQAAEKHQGAREEGDDHAGSEAYDTPIGLAGNNGHEVAVVRTKDASARQLLDNLGRKPACGRSFAPTKLLGDGRRLERVKLDGVTEREGGTDAGGRCES